MPDNIRITLNKDLSSLFNWNTKQLFVYLEAEYTNAKGVSSRHVPRISYGLYQGA
jgi:signal peptidase complex subunit 3